MQKKRYYVLFALLITALASCKDNHQPIHDLELATASLSAGVDMQRYLAITSGNKDYTISVEDTGIIETEYREESSYGSIAVIGKQKGQTILTVQDNVNGQKEHISITVTDGYMTMHVGGINAAILTTNEDEEEIIRQDMLENAFFQQSDIVSLVKNEKAAVYIFNSVEDATEGNIKKEASYEFVSEEESLYLAVLDENQQESYRYKINPDGSGYEWILNFFDLTPNAETAANSKILYEDGFTQNASPVEIGFYISADLTDRYHPNYPDLIEAKLENLFTIIPHSHGITLPDSLVQ